MDGRDGPVTYKPGWTQLYVNVKVPSELKYLVNYYKVVAGLPSFNWAVRQLLETHPALAKLAAELYTNSKAPDGPVTNPSQQREPEGDRRSSSVAGLFLGQLRSG